MKTNQNDKNNNDVELPIAMGLERLEAALNAELSPIEKQAYRIGYTDGMMFSLKNTRHDLTGWLEKFKNHQNPQ